MKGWNAIQNTASQKTLVSFCSSEIHTLSQESGKLQHCPSITSNQARIHEKLPQHHKLILPQTGKTLDRSSHQYHKVRKFLIMQRFAGAGAFPAHSTLPTTDQSIWWPKLRNSWFRLNISKSNNFSSACSRAWLQWNNIVTAEVKHSCMKKIKSRDQSLFRSHQFLQLMNKVFGVYAASNFYQFLHLQSMYYHSEATLTPAKESTFPPAPKQWATMWLKCPAKAWSYCTAILERKIKLCIEDSSCHRTTLCMWKKSLYFTFSRPHTSTYRE